MNIVNKVKRLDDVLEKILTNNKTIKNITTSDLTITEDLSTLDKNVIIISDQDNIKNIEIMSQTGVNHLIGKSENEGLELERCLNKISTNDIWGIEKYLENDAPIYTTTINHSKDFTVLINDLLSKLDTKDYFGNANDKIKLVINELVMNSFFHQESLINKDRKHSAFNSEDSICVSIGKDNNGIVLSVTDNIGSISRDQIITSLIRSFKEMKPKENSDGAGLGLYLVFQNINQLHINIKQGKKTEFVCIIDANKRFKKFKERVTSFHYFEEQ